MKKLPKHSFLHLIGAFFCLPCTFLCKDTLSYVIHRFHFTCLFCRWRLQWLGKWTMPKKWVKWYLPWSFKESQNCFEILIDPRGHFKMFRCCSIIVFCAIAFKMFNLTTNLHGKSKRAARAILFTPAVNIMEFIANVTI